MTEIEFSKMLNSLLLIDLQVDFLSENGRMAVAPDDAERVISTANRLIAFHKRRELPFSLVCSQYKKISVVGNYLRNYAAMEGSDGAKVDPRVLAHNPVTFPKPKVSAFSNPYLVEYLKQKLVDHVVICGVYAEGSVLATALDARRFHLEVTIISDGIASGEESRCLRAISDMRKRGIGIISLEEYLNSDIPPSPWID